MTLQVFYHREIVTTTDPGVTDEAGRIFWNAGTTVNVKEQVNVRTRPYGAQLTSAFTDFIEAEKLKMEEPWGIQITDQFNRDGQLDRRDVVLRLNQDSMVDPGALRIQISYNPHGKGAKPNYFIARLFNSRGWFSSDNIEWSVRGQPFPRKEGYTWTGKHGFSEMDPDYEPDAKRLEAAKGLAHLVESIVDTFLVKAGKDPRSAPRPAYVP